MRQISWQTMLWFFMASLMVVCLIFSSMAFGPCMDPFQTNGSNDPFFIFTLLLLKWPSSPERDHHQYHSYFPTFQKNDLTVLRSLSAHGLRVPPN